MASPYLDRDCEQRRRALKIQRSLQKKDSLDLMSGSDTDGVDLTKEIHPIGYYIDDRERMIEEMFAILKGEKLQRILPILLKDYTIEELKADCLVHLLGMSKKRIFAILQGRDLDSSSDSETEAETEAEDKRRKSHSRSNSREDELSKMATSAGKEESRRPKKHKSSVKNDKKPKKVNSPCIVISDDELEDIKPLKEERKTILKLRKERRVLKAKIEKRMKKTEKRKLTSQLQGIQVIDDSNDEPEPSKSDSDDEDKGKSLLEILELEMRARAIRALLRNTPNSEEPVPVSILNMKPEPDSVVETEINKTIADVIDERSSLDKARDLSSPTDDIEISEVCDILTVTIDDDDDVDIDLTASEDLNNVKPNETNATAVEQKNEISETRTTTAPILTTSKNANNPKTTEQNGGDVAENKVTWTERWAQSKGVTEVLKSNKLCANIRKRMRFARMLREKQSIVEQDQVRSIGNLQEEILSNLSSVEESSVAQYELIKSLDKLKSRTTEAMSNKEAIETNNEESTMDEANLLTSNKESMMISTEETSECNEEKLSADERVIGNNVCDIMLSVAENAVEESCIVVFDDDDVIGE